MTDAPPPSIPEIGRVLIVGGSGRLGRLLHRAWAVLGQGGLIWQDRRAGGLIFDPLTEPERFAEAARGADAILNLAGVTGTDPAELAVNTGLALAALRAGRSASVARVFLASSAAVYGGTGAGREADVPAPVSAYGQAKRDMESAALGRAGAGPAVTCLRIGNVAGADQLLGALPGSGPQMLDVFSDGTGPARSYIGPLALVRQLSGLFAAVHAGRALPSVLNLALEGTVRMEELLNADRRHWAARKAPQRLARTVRLDITELRRILPVAAADAAGIVADLRAIAPEGQE